jgi:hypothetical protein
MNNNQPEAKLENQGEDKFTSQVSQNVVEELQQAGYSENAAPKLTDEELVSLYVNNEENKANHLRIARQLELVFKNSWFTIEMINKKTLVKQKESATEMMLSMLLFKLCTAQDGGMKFKHKTKYKIMISGEEKLKVLLENKQNHLKQIALIDAEIENIELEQKNSSQNEK